MAQWIELLRVGLLLVDAAEEIAKAEGFSPEDFTVRRLKYEEERAVETDAAKAALKALLGKAKG